MEREIGTPGYFWTMLATALLAGFAGGTVSLWLPVRAIHALGLRSLFESEPIDVVKARRFVVIGTHNEERGELGLTERGEVALILRARAGRSVVVLTSDKQAAALSMGTDSGSAALMIDDGEGANVKLADAHGGFRFRIGLDSDQHPRLTLLDPHGRLVWYAPLTDVDRGRKTLNRNQWRKHDQTVSSTWDASYSR